MSVMLWVDMCHAHSIPFLNNSLVENMLFIEVCLIYRPDEVNDFNEFT
jgi:hypothetical protein